MYWFVKNEHSSTSNWCYQNKIQAFWSFIAPKWKVELNLLEHFFKFKFFFLRFLNNSNLLTLAEAGVFQCTILLVHVVFFLIPHNSPQLGRKNAPWRFSSNYPFIHQIKRDRTPISLLPWGRARAPPPSHCIVCRGDRYKSRIQQQTSVFGAAVVVSASTFITALVLDQPPIHLCITRPPENREARAISKQATRPDHPGGKGMRRLYTCNFNSQSGLSGALSKNKEVA